MNKDGVTTTKYIFDMHKMKLEHERNPLNHKIVKAYTKVRNPTIGSNENQATSQIQMCDNVICCKT